jgi:8-oxo-dGTP pyrophosphatase MutT (NUDIX family)/phosphohistidine phosphatase SixA
MPSSDESAREPSGDIISAGVVVLGRGKQVLLVHRPKYDDWSFPKGKLDPGERAAVAAVREVVEETGVRVRLGPPLSGQRYQVKDGAKTVRYWTGRVAEDSDVSTYLPNDEIDEVAWFDIEHARRRLTYDRDLDTLEEALGQPRRTRTFIVLRHAVARARSSWTGDDRMRPLRAAGRRQAERLVPVLAAYDVRRLVTSPSTRCVQSLEPYAHATGGKLQHADVLTEEEHSRKGVRRLTRELVRELEDAPARAGGLVLCTHRPVLPWVFDALAMDDPELEKGEMSVLHVRAGKVRASERHQAG